MIIELVKHVKSQTDDVTKYCFRVRGQIVEFSFIDKKDGKHIIVAPSQTRCGMGCKFCQMTELGGEVRDLTTEEIMTCAGRVISHQDRAPVGTLLVSFMGGGEPLLNAGQLVAAMVGLRADFCSTYQTVRFAVASIAAHRAKLVRFADMVKADGLDCKFHLSLHAMDATMRKKLMPVACGPYEAVDYVRKYQDITGCSVEIHYTPIEFMNDAIADAQALAMVSNARGWPVKLLDFKPQGGLHRTTVYTKVFDQFRRWVEAEGATVEVYSPPGADIGASCGQFLPEDYKL